MNDERIEYLYLTTTGWKSGNPHEIEIWFVEHGEKFYIVAEHRARSHWVQNIQHKAAINFRVDDSEFSGAGRVVNGGDEAELAAAVSTKMDDKYGWSAGLIVELAPDSSGG